MTEAMKRRIKNNLRDASIFSTPWLSAAAVALLALIIATFALQNYRLERRLMREALEQRADTLVRALRSGIRAALAGELQRHGRLGDDWPGLLQQVAAQSDEAHNALFIRISDGEGRVLAQTGKAAEGALTAESELTLLVRRRDGGMPHPFTGRGMMRRAMPPPPPLVWERRGPALQPGPPLPPDVSRMDFRLTVGLDAGSLDRALVRLRRQILLLSLALLLVGLGGWLSLAAAQGYRISRETVEKVRSYTALLVAQLPLGVIATTPGGRIETWNAAMQALTGLAARQARGRAPDEVLPPELAAFFADEGGAAGPPQRLTLTLAGRRRVLFCRPLALTDALQSDRGRVLLLSDITEQDDLERQMRENERLAAIGRVAGAVAHEVRNPLSSIKGLAFLLQGKFAEGSREREFAGLLVQETERLNRSITEMLELTRPAPLTLAPVDMAALLRQSLALMAAELEEAGIAARLDCPEALPPVLGDADRLRQVLMNVLLNARQAMEGSGCLTVTAAPSPDGRFLELAVADTGPGIPPDQLAHVFEPYFTTKAGGSGIGLAVTRKIVADHGGRIDIASEPGRGATAHISLPTAGFSSCRPGDGDKAPDPGIGAE